MTERKQIKSILICLKVKVAALHLQGHQSIESPVIKQRAVVLFLVALRLTGDLFLATSFNMQEPKCKDGGEYFDSRMDNFSTDTLAPSQQPTLLWSPSSSHILSQRSESTNAVSSDALRQNIYENFMRELEMSRTNLENTETSSETEDSSSESLSSLEQLDLLYEKEQGVVRKAGWLFFKPLVTLQKEKKLELVTRRKWKQYWVTLKGKLPCFPCGLAAPIISIVSAQLFPRDDSY